MWNIFKGIKYLMNIAKINYVTTNKDFNQSLSFFYQVCERDIISKSRIDEIKKHFSLKDIPFEMLG